MFSLTHLEVLELEGQLGGLAEHLQLDQVLQPLLGRDQRQKPTKD